MTATIYSMESVNLICGDEGNEAQPGISTHLTLNELKLPAMEETYVDHIPGGAPMGVEINMHLNRLEATFSLAGVQPDVMKLIGRSLRSLQHYTAYGLIRDQRSGIALKAQAILWGRMGRVNPTNFRKGDKFSHEYSLRGITHYEFYMQQVGSASIAQPGGATPDSTLQEIYYWDFFEPALRIGGVDIKTEENQILGIFAAAI